YAEPARVYLERIAPRALDNPFGFGQTIGAMDRLVRGSTDVVIFSSSADEGGRALHRKALATYLPNRNIAWADPGRPASMEAAPWLRKDKPVSSARGAAVAYVCRGRTCSLPVDTPGALADLLKTQ